MRRQNNHQPSIEKKRNNFNQFNRSNNRSGNRSGGKSGKSK